MTDDKITISREQFETWYNVGGCSGKPFDSLKAFVEKPKRREWFLYNVDDDWNKHFHSFELPKDPNGIFVREVLPDDLPPMTKGEMRELLQKVSDGARPEAFPVTTFHMRILKALGIEE